MSRAEISRYLFALWLGVSAGSSAAAATSTDETYPLDHAGCDQLDVESLRELIAVELSTVTAQRPPSTGSSRIRLLCSGDSVSIHVIDSQSQLELRSEIRLAPAVRATHPRLLALAITELVATNWNTTDAAPGASPAAPSAVPPPADGTPSLSTASRPRDPGNLERVFQLSVAGSVRRLGQPGTWLGGVVLGGEAALGNRFAVALDLRGELGETATAVAAVAWKVVGANAKALAKLSRGKTTLKAGPGIGLAFVQFAADPGVPGVRGATLAGMSAGPSLSAIVARQLGASHVILLNVEAGLVTRSVAGLLDGDRHLVAMDGLWVSVAIGVGMDL